MKLIKRILMTAVILIASTACAYASMDDKSDRMSSNQSNTFSPGYINATMQKTQEIIKQAQYDKNPTDNIENKNEVADNKLSNKVAQNAATRVTPELKKKTSSSVESQTIAAKEAPAEYAIAPQGSITITPTTKVNIGSGTLQHYEDGRMVSEYINGVKYIYVGFDKVGFASNGGINPVQSAINQATANDVILIRGGAGKTYAGDLTVSSSVHLYGGFDETGQRNASANPTNIIGNVTTLASAPTVEMNRINMSGGIVNINSGSNLYLKESSSSSSFIVRGGIYCGGSNFGSMVVYGLLSPGGPADSFSVSTLGTQTKQVLVEKTPSTTSFAVVLASNYNDLLKTQKITEDNYLGTSAYSADTAKNSTSNQALLSTMNAFFKGKDVGLLNNVVDARDVSVRNNGLTGNALAIPMITAEDVTKGADSMKLALVLTNILKNPTSDQKLMLDTMQALLAETEKSASQSTEVKKAQDDLLQVVANILIAQAMPDLLKEGDMSNIKGIFQDMNAQKEKIMLEYNLVIDPYYKEVKKLLAKNLALLQLNNIVSNTMVEEELNNLEPNAVDKLLEKLRKVSNKSFEEEYILQQEAKYRKEYIDPNKKAFEEKMRAMLEGFTQRLSLALENTKPVKK